MNVRSKFLPFLVGWSIVAAPAAFGQTEQPASTNAPAIRTPPALPPLPPTLQLPTNFQQIIRASQITNHQQRLQGIQGAGNASGVTVIARMTNFAAQPGRPPSFAVSPLANRPVPVVAQPLPLVADADVKEYTAKPGETNAQFTFTLTNPSTNAVTINDVRASCSCTVAKLPSRPWVIEPGTNGQVHVTVDLRGKRGQITKLVYVYGATGTKTLTVKVNIPGVPPGAMADRAKNIQIATADRQAVFKNDCAQCHAEPAIGKNGEALYLAACANCHDSEHRASMVPNLHALNHPTDREHWKNWVTHGKAGTLMPAFARAEGGPLADEQINSLVDYLMEHIPSRPAAALAAPAAKLPASE